MAPCESQLAIVPPRCRVGIIVAGMHRSGTSATTRTISLLGADIARDLMPSMDENNTKGFWESIAVANIHDSLLCRLGSGWDDPMPLRDRWLDTDQARQAKDALAREIAKQFSDSHVFVVKDPRVSRLLPLWLELFDELAVTPIVVIVLRNPLEVALSLRKRDQFPLDKSLLIYARCYLEVELASRQRRRIFVNYEQLLADWRPFSHKLRQIIGPLMPPVNPESTAQISNFLDRDLHHNRCTDEELSSTPRMSPTIVEMYQQMVEASETGDESSLCGSFDRLERVLTDATNLFQGLVAAEAEKNLEKSIETALLKSELEVARRRSADLAAALGARSAEAVQLRGELTAWQERTARFEDTLAARLRELDAIRRSTSWRLTAPVRWIGKRRPRSSPSYES